MTKIIPTGIICWKVIPVGTKCECMAWNPVGAVEVPVGLFAEKAARSLPISASLTWSAWQTEQKRPHGSFAMLEIVLKEHSKGGIMFLTTRKDMREIPELLEWRVRIWNRPGRVNVIVPVGTTRSTGRGLKFWICDWWTFTNQKDVAWERLFFCRHVDLSLIHIWRCRRRG